MKFVSIVKLDDNIKRHIKSCDQEARDLLMEYGIEHGVRVAWIDGYGDTVIGEVYFTDRDLWVRDCNGHLELFTPLCKIDFLVILEK